MKTFASASHLHDAVKAIAGSNCQFLAADILCVYDDSIGAHRDLLYEFDTPKVLVFLSDCSAEAITVPKAYALRHFAGAFAVLSGSHIPGSFYNSLSAQLSDWPNPSNSYRLDITPHFMLGDRKVNGDVFYPYLDYDSRYQGYSLIPFKRGDVVIFSTRALHALLPTFSPHFAKLASFVFIEDFAKATGAPLDFDKPIHLMTDQEYRYISLPYNSRLNDLLMRGADYETSLHDTQQHPSCLKNQLAENDMMFNSVFEPLTRIYRICEGNCEGFLERRMNSGRDAVLDDFTHLVKQQHAELDAYYSRLSNEELGIPVSPKSSFLSETVRLRDQYLSRQAVLPQVVPPNGSPTSSPSGTRNRLRNIVRKAAASLKSLLAHYFKS